MFLNALCVVNICDRSADFVLEASSVAIDESNEGFTVHVEDSIGSVINDVDNNEEDFMGSIDDCNGTMELMVVDIDVIGGIAVCNVDDSNGTVFVGNDESGVVLVNFDDAVGAAAIAVDALKEDVSIDAGDFNETVVAAVGENDRTVEEDVDNSICTVVAVSTFEKSSTVIVDDSNGTVSVDIDACDVVGLSADESIDAIVVSFNLIG